jgi:hypothetical protein
VADWPRSGLTQDKYCARHGISVGSLQRSRNILAQDVAPQSGTPTSMCCRRIRFRRICLCSVTGRGIRSRYWCGTTVASGCGTGVWRRNVSGGRRALQRVPWNCQCASCNGSWRDWIRAQSRGIERSISLCFSLCFCGIIKVFWVGFRQADSEAQAVARTPATGRAHPGSAPG